LFTIANDLAEFRDFKEGDTICHQDNESKFNLMYMQQERAAIMKLSDVTDPALKNDF
jgi:hypothetical protein